jgi:hypothetical protein
MPRTSIRRGCCILVEFGKILTLMPSKICGMHAMHPALWHDWSRICGMHAMHLAPPVPLLEIYAWSTSRRPMGGGCHLYRSSAMPPFSKMCVAESPMLLCRKRRTGKLTSDSSPSKVACMVAVRTHRRSPGRGHRVRCELRSIPSLTWLMRWLPRVRAFACVGRIDGFLWLVSVFCAETICIQPCASAGSLATPPMIRESVAMRVPSLASWCRSNHLGKRQNQENSRSNISIEKVVWVCDYLSIALMDYKTIKNCSVFIVYHNHRVVLM